MSVGRTIRIGRTAATIVGVAERGFTVPNNRLLWMPLTAYDAVYSVRAPCSADRAKRNGPGFRTVVAERLARRG